MILPLPQSQQTEPGGARQFLRMHAPSFAVGATAFACTFPYPAIDIGSASAIQIGNIFSVALILPAIGRACRRWQHGLLLLILVPLGISAMKVATTGDGQLDLAVKTIAAWAVAIITILATQLYAPRHALAMLTGIAIGTLIHTMVGLWQFYCFSNSEELPFAWIYVNQSFLNIQEAATIITRYIQRPFGLFPEPSAMSCSLGPWVLIWSALLCGVVRLRQELAIWHRVLFAAAAVGGLLLIILSQSGHAVVVLFGLLIFGTLWLKRAPATPRTLAIVIVMIAIVLPVVLYMAGSELSNRVGSAESLNGSWQERFDSIRVGFDLFTGSDLTTLLFGLGTGQINDAIEKAAHLEAVWSILLVYIYETGLIGLLVVCLIGSHLLRIWRIIQFDSVFAAFAIVWLVGITVITSYHQLLLPWMAFGWLTSWPLILAPPRARRSISAVRKSRRAVRPLPWRPLLAAEGGLE